VKGIIGGRKKKGCQWFWSRQWFVQSSFLWCILTEYIKLGLSVCSPAKKSTSKKGATLPDTDMSSIPSPILYQLILSSLRISSFVSYTPRFSIYSVQLYLLRIRLQSISCFHCCHHWALSLSSLSSSLVLTGHSSKPQ
jgi:hypothetical protein